MSVIAPTPVPGPNAPTKAPGTSGDGAPALAASDAVASTRARPPWVMALRAGRVLVGGAVLLFTLLACVASMPWTLHTPEGNSAVYEQQNNATARHAPTLFGPPAGWFG